MNIFNYIKDKVDYREIFGAYSIPYEEYGNEKFMYKAICPFEGCKDKKKSFSVATESKMFYCLNCYSCGDVSDFVSKLENKTPIDAIRKLISYYHDWKTKEPLKIPKEYEEWSREKFGNHFVDSYIVK